MECNVTSCSGHLYTTSLHSQYLFLVRLNVVCWTFKYHSNQQKGPILWSSSASYSYFRCLIESFYMF